MLWEIGDGPSKQTRFPWLHAREIRQSRVAYHFPIRVGDGLDVPVAAGLEVDRGDGGHRRRGRDWRADRRFLLLNRHVGWVSGCWVLGERRR